MWEINKAFEASLRGGPDGSVRQPRPSKTEMVRRHHRTCTGAFHGCGVEKTSASGRPASLDLSDTDSGRESLVSPQRNSKPESLDEDAGCECRCHVTAVSEGEMLNDAGCECRCHVTAVSEGEMLNDAGCECRCHVTAVSEGEMLNDAGCECRCHVTAVSEGEMLKRLCALNDAGCECRCHVTAVSEGEMLNDAGCECRCHVTAVSEGEMLNDAGCECRCHVTAVSEGEMLNDAGCECRCHVTAVSEGEMLNDAGCECRCHVTAVSEGEMLNDAGCECRCHVTAVSEGEMLNDAGCECRCHVTAVSEGEMLNDAGCECRCHVTAVSEGEMLNDAGCECRCHVTAVSEGEMLKRLCALNDAGSTLAMEGIEQITNRLSLRRKKRNQRIAEHVDGVARKSVNAPDVAVPASMDSSPKSEVKKQVSSGFTENGFSKGSKVVAKVVVGKKPKASVVKENGSKCPELKVVKQGTDAADEGSRKPALDVKEVTRDTKRTPPPKSVKREAVQGKPTTAPVKMVGVARRNSKPDVSVVGRTPVPRIPKSQFARRPSRTLAGVPKVEWAEVYDAALNRKPGSGSALYRDLHEAICDSLLSSLKLEARSEEQLATERAWLEAERLWLVHRAGFTAARRLEEQEADGGGGRITVRLEGAGDVLTVEDDDVEKANPPQFDRVEDLGHLRYLNESSVLHTLRQRYASNLIHTYAGSSLLIINPTAPLAIYSDKVVHMFRGCKTEDMPPHIYSLAQSAYRGMLASRRDQAIVLLGRSASGKTTNFKHVLHYLMLAAGSVNKILTIEKLNAIGTVLEAFGNARTVLNANATRFTQIFSLDFDQSGQISSASIQVLLVERSRVARRPEGEASFHILYQLLAGVEGQLRKHLRLEAAPVSEQNLFVSPLSRHEDKQKAMLEFGRVCTALKVLGVTDTETRVVWSVLAAIFHLGYAGAVRSGSSSSRWQFASPQCAQQAAHLLGTTVEELARCLFGQGAGGTPSTPRAPFRTPSPTETRSLDVTGLEALEGMVIGLYGEVFNAIAALINRSISTPIHTVSSLIVVDAPGFQNPASCGHQGGATFEDLCHNYLHERLQLLFHHTSLTAPRDRYIQENIDCQCDDGVDSGSGPAPLVSLLDRAAQSAIVRTSQTDLRDIDRRGLLWLLDEQAVFPYASEEAFLERLFQHYSDREHQVLLRKAPGHNQFILQHLQGTNPVLYSATGWLKASRENPVAKTVVTILQESNKEEVSQLFVSCRGSGVSGGSIVGIEGTQSLRRASSIRRTFTTGAAGIKRKSLCLQVKFTVDGLVETLRRTRLKFVHCLLPQHSAGLTGLRTSLLKGGNADDDLLNIPLLRSQLRGSQLIPAVRLHKQGFPKLLPLPEFRRRFRLLSPAETRPISPVPDERRAVEDMLIGMDMDLASYRVGLSQIFFRSGVLAQLEGQRDERLTEHVVKLQSRCRGYLARRKLAKLRLQDVAMRCIQRNVRQLLAVQDWPWWKLLMKVTPLLNVHRTEEELKVKTEELDTLRNKVEKLETERSQLQHDNDKLGAKLSEMTADLAEEHSTSTLATERLEAETSERLRLERELQEIQVQHSTLSATSERLETELLYLRAVDAPSEDEEGTGDAGVYKQRYERVLRELEFTKHRLQQQHEDDLEQLVALKKQLEKKLSDAYEEVQEQRQVAGQWKRKVQKLQAETNDLRLLSEEQNSRNTLLEKKQRKFDAEFQLLQEQCRQEKQQRDRSSREREMALGEKYTLEQNLSATRLELELKEEQVNSLTRELDDLVTGGHTDLEVASLKRSKNELEKKLQEQEEELDDLAGQLAMLGQAKLRLEMNLEQQRKESRREAAQRDEELEDVRCNATKKVKALESQLESEHEERTLLLREKHELERRASAAEDAAGRSQAERDQVARLKRDLRRTRALLRDAHLVMQKNTGDASAKTLVRQLRNQLEDAELARASAAKARQGAEAELSEVAAQLEEATRGRGDADERAASAARLGQELRTQLDENEEELAEVLKKYRSCVQQLSTEQLAQQEQAAVVAQLEQERAALREQLSELTARLECVETLSDPGSSLAQRRLELKTREMESRLELEQTTRARLEVQISRLKDAVEKLQSEATHARAKEQSALAESRKVSRSLREARDEASASTAREAEATQRRKDAETRLEAAQAETLAVKADLRLALTRINDLQTAIQDDCSQTESDHESESDESIENFLVNNETSATWDRSRVSLNRSPRQSPSDFESKSIDLPKTISDSTTKESYA